MDHSVEPTPFWDGFDYHDTKSVFNILKEEAYFTPKRESLKKFPPGRDGVPHLVYRCYRKYDQGRETLKVFTSG